MKSYKNLKAESVSLDKVRDYWKGKNIPQLWYSDIDPGSISFYNNIRKQRFELYYPYLKDSAEFKYHEGEKILESNNGLDDFGKLLHNAWITKKKLSKNISTTKIDEIYDYVLKQGALGGKLLGAGGGGFFLFYMKHELQKNFLKKNQKLINVPFKFSDEGTEIIHKN